MFYFKKVRRRRFELLKAMPADLQSAPVDRLGTDACFFILALSKKHAQVRLKYHT